MSASTPIQTSLSNLSAWASFDTLLQRLNITTDPNFWDGLVTLIHYQDYFLESQYHDLEEGCVPDETQQGPNKTQTPNPPNQADPACLCANSPFYAWEIHGIECTEYRLLYWYHPDYLGHNEFITDNSGLPYQYFQYSAFGETLVEDNAHYGQFSSPYRFNAKELDQEPSRASSRNPLKNKTRGEQTGNYYYGARYYNPTWSVWLSVDPLAGKYPGLTPYNFSNLNPIRFVDPNELEGYEVDQNGYIKKMEGEKGDYRYFVENGNTDEIVVVLPGEDYNGDGKEVDYLVSKMNSSNGRVIVEKGALAKEESTISKNRPNELTHYYKFKDIQNAEEVYKYLGDNTNVEWGRGVINSYENGVGLSYIGTTHIEGYNWVEAVFETMFGHLLIDFSHSHSDDPNPSFDVNGSSSGDLNSAAKSTYIRARSVYHQGQYSHFSSHTYFTRHSRPYDKRNTEPW